MPPLPTPSTIDFGPANAALEDAAVTEVMINGAHDIWVERHGELFKTNLEFRDNAALRTLINSIATFMGRRVSEQEPLLDARLPDGSRVNVVLPPLSLTGPVVTIRRFPAHAMTGEELIERGSITRPALDFLWGCVLARRSILISGGTGTGKTTLLNALSQYILDRDRIITIEDTAELRLHQPHWLRLEARPDAGGSGEITIRDLVRNSLRMRPDRIIVGEVRGGEAFDMLQAMNTGHDGSMSTVHANSPRDALARLETLVLMAGLDIPQRAVRDQIASAVKLLVHIDRGADGKRRVARISEIVGREGEVVTMQDVFILREERTRSGDVTAALVSLPVRPQALDHMARVSEHLPPGLFDFFPDPILNQARRGKGGPPRR